MNTLQDYVNYKLTHADKVAEAEGYPLKMENCKKYKKMKQLELYGNSLQDGTPTPDNPIEVQSVGELVTDGADSNYGKYKIPVVVKCKNLWDKENYLVSSAQDGSLRREFLATEYDWLKPGNTITLSLTIFVSENDTRVNPKFTCCVLGTDGKEYGHRHLSSYSKGVEERKFGSYTIPQIAVGIKALYVRPIDYSSNSGGVWDAYAKDIQIELGDTASDYEPYIEPVTTNIFLDEPLRKLGDYADYIDLKNKKVVRNVREVILQGGEITYAHTSYSNKYGYYIYGTSSIYKDADNTLFYTDSTQAKNIPALSNMFYKETYAYSPVGNPGEWYVNSLYRICFLLAPEFSASDGASSTLEDINNWLQSQYEAGTPATFYYVKNEALEEPLNIGLPKLTAKTSIIEVDTSLTPTNAYGKYIKR